MQINSVVLVNSSIVGSSAAGGTAFAWLGGRASLALTATAYGSIYFQGLAGTKWVNMHSSALGTDQFMEFALTPGQYKIVNTSSSAVAIYATLCSIPQV